MENTFKTIDFTNEKGNVSVKVRNIVREQSIAKFIPEGFELSEDGSTYVKQIAIDARTGSPVYATLALTVTNVMPTKKERKASEKNAVKVEVHVPSLFDAE